MASWTSRGKGGRFASSVATKGVSLDGTDSKNLAERIKKGKATCRQPFSAVLWPFMMLALPGVQMAFWQKALSNTTPFRARESIVVLEHLRFGRLAGWVGLAVNPLGFQLAEEALRRSVVPAVACSLSRFALLAALPGGLRGMPPGPAGRGQCGFKRWDAIGGAVPGRSPGVRAAGRKKKPSSSRLTAES